MIEYVDPRGHTVGLTTRLSTVRQHPWESTSLENPCKYSDGADLYSILELITFCEESLFPGNPAVGTQ